MTFSLFSLFIYLLLYILICSLLCKEVCANKNTELPAPETPINLFPEGKITGDVLQQNGDKIQQSDETTDVIVKNYYTPYLISTSDVVVALAGVNSDSENDKKITVLTNYIVTEGDNNWWENKVAKKIGSAGGWTVQFAATKEIQRDDDSNVLKGFLSVAKDKKIYLLLVNCSSKKDSESAETNCDFEINVGNVAEGGSNEKKIIWKNSTVPQESKKKLNVQFKKNFKCEYPIFGNAFLTNENNAIFVVKAKGTKEESITLLVHLKINKDELEDISVTDISNNCYPYIFLWNNKIIKFTPDCKKNEQTSITEITKIEENWSESQTQESLIRLVSFFKDKNNFFTATTNENKQFILFTESIGEKQNLWISDGTRATTVGEITTNSKCIIFNNIFYTKGELLLFTPKCNTDNKLESIHLTRLEEQTKKIKEVLNAWNTKNNKIGQLCKDPNPKNVYCNTDRLVGFLSNIIISENGKKQWKDEFLYRNATIMEDGNSEDDGITFKGEKAGAEWPVVNKNNGQPYNFFDPGFTLVVTVTVHKVTGNNHNSIFGVAFAENKRTISLLCSNEGNWVLRSKEKTTELQPTNENCKHSNTYQVVIIFEQEKKITLYINGNHIDSVKKEILQIEKEKNILNFYFGVDKELTDDETNITIRNVLLYNHPFNSDEISKLEVVKNEKTTIARKENSENNIPQQQSSDDNTEMTEKTVRSGRDEMSPDTVTEEVVQSSKQQRESAVGIDNNVFVTVLYLLSVACVGYCVLFI